MKRLLKTSSALALALLMIVSLTVQGQDSGETLVLTRASAEAFLLTDNTTLKGLEVSEMDLLTAWNDVQAAGDAMESIYDQLARYDDLYNKNLNMMANPSYTAYFGLITAGVGSGRENDLDLYLTELQGATEPDNDLISKVEQRISLESSFTDEDYASIMTTQEFGELQGLMAMFENMGFSSPNLSDEDIYNTFIITMEVTPLTLQASLESLQLNMVTLEGSLVTGMNSLYDSLLDMEGTLDILYNSYISALEAAKASDARLAMGMVTEADNRQAWISETTARLAYDQMVRTVDNMTLSLKDMLGIDPSTVLVLDGQVSQLIDLDPVEVYMDQALLNRSEIITAQNDVYVKSSEISIMEEWLKDSNDDLMEARESLEQLERDLAQVERDVEVDLLKAYSNVQTAELDLIDGENALQIAEKQLEEMTIRVEIGTMLESSLSQMEVSVIAAQNTLTGAQNTYRSALMALENATGISQ